MAAPSEEVKFRNATKIKIRITIRAPPEKFQKKN